jgi:hypothetical protein
MKYISIWLLVGLVCLASAGQRIERIVRPDTIMTVKADTVKTMKVDTTKNIRMDTTYSVRYDTLIITAVYRDTSVFVKQDTARKYSKPIKIKRSK